MEIKNNIIAFILLVIITALSYRFGVMIERKKYILMDKKMLETEYQRGFGDGEYHMMNQMTEILRSQGIIVEKKKIK